MYTVKYSRFASKWVVVGSNGLAQSAWISRQMAMMTATSLNRNSYDRPRK